MSKNCPDCAGFSLLEVIVALAIMAVGFVTILRLFSGSIQSIEMTDEYLRGLTLANNKMSDLELSDFQTEVFSGQFPGEKYTWQLLIEPYNTPHNVPEARINVVRARLFVSWNSGNKERTLELVTLKTMGNVVPATDQVIQGLEQSGVYGQRAAGVVAFASIAAPPAVEEATATAKVAFCGKQATLNVDISGLGKTVRLSGVPQEK